MMGHQNDHKVNLIVQSYGNLVSPKPQNISKRPEDDFEIVPWTNFKVIPEDLKESIPRSSIIDRSYLRKSGAVSSQRSMNVEDTRHVDVDYAWENSEEHGSV
jgi:hypothetical protein